MTEFALVVPVLFLLILGVVDGGLVLFSVATSRYAAVEGAREAAQLGNATNTDAKVLQIVRNTVGQTTIFSVDEVDIYKLDQNVQGDLTQNVANTNKYRLDGTPMTSPEPWPAANRKVQNGSSDFLGLTVFFTYRWKAGFFAPLGPLRTTATYYVRLEPQS